MSGIYGELLLAFPEQQRTLTVYQMTPAINDGWEIVDGSSRIVSGIYQNTSGHQIKDSNGNLTKSSGFEFWTATEDLDGYFAQINGVVHRLVTSNDWQHEGGYTRYSLEDVGGSDGTESIDVTWNLGSNTFG